MNCIITQRALRAPLSQAACQRCHITAKHANLIQRQRYLPIQRRHLNGQAPSPDPNINPADDGYDESAKRKKDDQDSWRNTAFKMFESSMTTLASIAALGLVGYSYTVYYKYRILRKMEHAFDPGDPVLDLAARGKRDAPTTYHAAKGAGQVAEEDSEEHKHEHWIHREEQDTIDAIVRGDDRGRYHLLIGEKGTGKSSMLIDAMFKVNGEGCAMFEAHADLEIFRVRLGKALDFEYHEDNIGSLFSIRGPREGGALLDIERAFNKLEKVAMKRRETKKKPIILIINNVHLLRDDHDGQDLIELIQQKAEQWAASNVCTIILNSDDYWVYERLKNYATRMAVMPIRDLAKPKAVTALSQYRKKYYNEEASPEILEKVYDKVGGRLTFLNRVAKARDMLAVCDDINRIEKTWFLNKLWILGEEMDDDVMDQQKYASAAMVLAKALVDKEKEMDSVYDEHRGHILPEIPLYQALQIMTRVDFIQSYDTINVFTIDSNAMVRADSVPMMNAFREVCSQEGFEEHLEGTLQRISDIESLGRTKELTIKDLWDKGKYKITARTARGAIERDITFEVEKKEDDDDDD